MAREARNHVGATTPACGGPHEIGAWEEASASASAHPAHARQSPGRQTRSGAVRSEALSGCPPQCSRLSKHLHRGVHSNPADASRRRLRFRPSFRPLEERRSIPQAKGKDGTETLQHSLVRTLASRTTRSVCRRRAIAGNDFPAPPLESLARMGLGLTGISTPTPTPTTTPG